MKKHILLITVLLGSFYTTAQQTILINNVQIFNGKDEKTITGNVLIVNNHISRISASPIATNKSGETKIIDGKGKFLMPGLIDAHTHIMMESLGITELMNSDIEYITVNAVNSAEKDLMQGFTTFRDLSGPSFGLQKAIDKGLMKGPRIYPSGSMISQTSGHGDFLSLNSVPRDAQLLTLSGPGNPYPDKLGVIEEGAYADLLLVEGNPLINLNILENYDKNILLIMKDGVIYKNVLNN